MTGRQDAGAVCLARRIGSNDFIRYGKSVLDLSRTQWVASPLLLTKLHVPSPRSHLVRRDCILQTLQNGLTSRLILISAAAGLGKTTVLSKWVQQIQHPVGWLSLDERDNAPTGFWSYLVAALQKADGDIGEATLSILQSPNPCPMRCF